LELETKEALDSRAWLNMSSNSILEFLDMECLNINEADLLKALMRWGSFQIQKQDRDNLDENLRTKILPGMRKIRFGSLTQQEIVQLCQEELGKVLSADEKCSICMSVMSGNWSLMPNDVVPATKLAPRHEPYTFCSLPFAADPKNKEKYRCKKSKDIILCFQVVNKAAIVGVKLNLSAQSHDRMTFSLRDDDDADAVMATGSVKITSLHRGEVFCPFNTLQTVDPYSSYSVYFTCNGYCNEHCIYALPKNKNPSVSDGLTLRIFTLNTYVPVEGLVFQKVDKSL
jgi:hypothetical protein